MPNLDALRTRVERAERSLKSVQTTRDMESEALVEMWRQIRERYEAQESEIQLYRDKLDQVEVQHTELCKLVEALLAVVEKSTGRSSDDTVPRITGLAEAMLEGRDAPETTEQRNFEVGDEDDRHDVDDAKAIEILRAELDQLGERLGAKR